MLRLVWLLAVVLFDGRVLAQATADLEALQQQRVITTQERRDLEQGVLRTPIQRSALKDGCASGALSRLECASGVAIPPGASRHRPRIDNESPVESRQPEGPVTVPVSALLAQGKATFDLASVFAVTPRPPAVRGNQDNQLLFPVLGSAVVSSGFGWRLHPVLRSWLMHAGRDIAAPEGTPVVASRSGIVLSSGLAGGYGLAIELEHRAPHRRTLYGHLSELYVRSGDAVQQGEVIGRVGSTGLSTGPHLHFEVRRVERGRWVAVDPGTLDPAPLGVEGQDAVALLLQQVMGALERP